MNELDKPEWIAHGAYTDAALVHTMLTLLKYMAFYSTTLLAQTRTIPTPVPPNLGVSFFEGTPPIWLGNQPVLQGSLKDTFCSFETWLFPPK